VSAEEPVCPPFPSQPPPSLDSFYEPGLRGSDAGAVLATEQGKVVPLAPAPAPDGVPAVPGEALLALPKNARGSVPKDFGLAAGARVADSFWSSVLCAAVLRVVGPSDRTPEQLVPRVPETAVAAPNHVYRTAGVAVRPLAVREGPDPYRALQWGHDRLGVAASRVRGDGAGARVVVLDSAPEVQHPELAGVRVRALPGGPEPTPAAHGTLVTGVVRALENNGFGIAGVAPGAVLVAIPICVPGAQGAADACRLYDTLRGIEAAWEEKAGVVNLAFVGPPNPLLERAVERLEDLGVLVVAAAGNEATREPRYPAAYPSVIGVGAIDREGRAYEHGNLGASAELEAPGVEILSTHPGASFAFADGTSMAAAHVSGTLAILLGAGVSPLDARVAVLALGGRSSRRGVIALAPVCDLLKRGDRSC
jgi:subtilisin family serine protease